jgi:PAS domain S-box-containing protein
VTATSVAVVDSAQASDMTRSPQKHKRVRLDTSALRNREDLLSREAERQSLLLEVTSDLIRVSDPGELGRTTFEHIKSAFGAVVCTNYRLDPTGRRLNLAFAHGLPPGKLEAVHSLELGQEYCGTAAASRQRLVADKQRITSDPKGGLVRELGATAYACYPLKASDGRLLGTFAVASATRESFTDDEVALLGTVANFLAQAWERFDAEQALRASKDRLQLALDAAQLGAWQYDPLQRVVSGDMRCQEILDFPKHEAPIDEIMKLVHPDDAERVLAALDASLNPADPKRATTEFRIRRRDGEIRWVETFGFAYFAGAAHERQAVSNIGTLQDITERKIRVERENLLMREVNHRAKNMLSVVDAIAHQTIIRNPDDFIDRFSERIQALSANQDLLVRNQWQGVDVEELVHAQLAPFGELIGSRIAVYGPKLRFKAASAQAVGLALRELATNAGRYGALSTDHGRVDVCWGTNSGTFTMSWTERGGPPVSPPKQRGFGTTVMESMAERSLDGQVRLDYLSSGVIWHLTCPAANALE